MERLTVVPNDGRDAGLRGFCTEQDAINRLATYEDTGLEPEDINEFVDSYKTMRDNEEARVRLMCGTGVIHPERAAEITKAEAEGRLVVLPCKVGDTVYTAQRGMVSELSVDHFELYNVGIWVSWHLVSGIYGNFRMDGFPASDIGKTVFRTREEAEAKLKEGTSNGQADSQ